MRFFKTLGKMRGIAVELFGDATHVDAGTAQARARQTTILTVAAMHATHLSQRDFGPALRRHARRPHAATAAANDEEVKIKSGHQCGHIVTFCRAF